MNELLDRFEMKTNFEGLIKLLAKNLYAEPSVFIRELIQNAHDSIVRRQMSEKNCAGYIDIHIVKHENKIVFVDNGIGMDEDDIRNFLSVIGSTGTGTTRNQQQGQGLDFNLIGQFGIGMLSAFVVASKVIVQTKKMGTERAFAWHNTGSTECLLYEDEKENVGTVINVYVNDEHRFVLNREYIQEAIRKYCDFIPFPINIDNQATVNIQNAPWHKTFHSEQEKTQAYELFLRRRFRELILDVIPIEISGTYEARGALFISDSLLPDIATAGKMDIFIRRMFVRSDDHEMLPVWAKFVQGIIDSPDLKPTAARDNIQRNEAAYEFIQDKLAEIIVNHLIDLAKNNPTKFKHINKTHHYHLKGMAASHHYFFEKISEFLLFETNRGQLSLQEVLKANESYKDDDGRIPVYYFKSKNSAPQFYSLANAKGWVVVNAGLIFEVPLLERFAYFNPEKIILEQLDTSDNPQMFERLSDDEQESFRILELEMENVLKRQGIERTWVRTRRFVPNELPAVLITTAETEADLKLKRLVEEADLLGFDDIAMETLKSGRKPPVYLSINANNMLIKQLAKSESYKQIDEQTRRVIIMGLYNSTLLYSHDLLDTNATQRIHKHFVQMIDLIVNMLGK